MHLAGGPRVHALRSAPIVISGLISSRLPRLCSAQPSPPETRQGWKIAASAAAGQTEIRGAPSFISPFAISPDQPAASASVSPPSAPAIPSHLRRPGHCSSLLRPAAPPPVSADCRSRSGTYLPPACHRSLFGSLCIAFAYDRPLPSSSSSAALPPPPPRHMHPSPSACCLASAVPLPPAPPVSSGGMNPHAPLPLHAYRWCGCGDHRGYAPPCPSSARPVPRACVPRDGFPCPPPPSLRPTVPGAGSPCRCRLPPSPAAIGSVCASVCSPPSPCHSAVSDPLLPAEVVAQMMPSTSCQMSSRRLSRWALSCLRSICPHVITRPFCPASPCACIDFSLSCLCP